MRTVRAFGKELSEIRAYTQKADEVFNLARKEAVVRAGFFGAVSLSAFISYTKQSFTILPLMASTIRSLFFQTFYQFINP